MVGGSLLAVLFGFAVWLFVSSPLLVNPFEVASRLEDGTIDESTMWMLAALLPITMGLCLVLVAVVIFFVFSAFANERRHLKIIDRLREGREINGREG
jgi:hypothetical protein